MIVNKSNLRKIEKEYNEKDLEEIILQNVKGCFYKREVSAFSEWEFKEYIPEVVEGRIDNLNEQDEQDEQDGEVLGINHEAIEVAELIFLQAEEKGIKVLRDPININFELDDIDDIVVNYPLKDIKKALDTINQFDSKIINKLTLNTLDVARKYLNGDAKEHQEE